MDNFPNINTLPWGIQVARGSMTGVTKENKFGSNLAVGTSLVPVTRGGSVGMPTSNQSLEVVSSDNVNDIPAGSGAREVTVQGLIDNAGVWEEQSEVVALNGTTPVNLTKTWIRVNRMFVSSSGAYANKTTPSHNSTITLRDQGGLGDDWVVIGAEKNFGMGQSQQGVVSIPSNQAVFVRTKSVTVESTKAVDTYFFVRDNAADYAVPYSGVMRVKQVNHGLNSPVADFNDIVEGPFYGPCDMGFMATVGTGTAQVGVEFDLIKIAT